MLFLLKKSYVEFELLIILTILAQISAFIAKTRINISNINKICNMIKISNFVKLHCIKSKIKKLYICNIRYFVIYYSIINYT